MQVELLVNLKIGNGKVVPAGTMFTDPIPEFILKRIPRGQARIIPEKKIAAVLAPAAKQVVKVPEVVKEAPKVPSADKSDRTPKTSDKPLKAKKEPVVKKMLLKKKADEQPDKV